MPRHPGGSLSSCDMFSRCGILVTITNMPAPGILGAAPVQKPWTAVLPVIIMGYSHGIDLKRKGVERQCEDCHNKCDNTNMRRCACTYIRTGTHTHNTHKHACTHTHYIAPTPHRANTTSVAGLPWYREISSECRDEDEDRERQRDPKQVAHL